MSQPFYSLYWISRWSSRNFHSDWWKPEWFLVHCELWRQFHAQNYVVQLYGFLSYKYTHLYLRDLWNFSHHSFVPRTVPHDFPLVQTCWLLNFQASSQFSNPSTLNTEFPLPAPQSIMLEVRSPVRSPGWS